MSENIFSPKMKGKSIMELRTIITSKDYGAEARQAAQVELDSRNESEFKTPDKAPSLKPSGEEQYAEFLKTVEKRVSRGWTPKYNEAFKAGISNDQVIIIAKEVFEKLEWRILQSDDMWVMALRSNAFGTGTERVNIGINPEGQAFAYSESWRNHFFDRSRNHKWVKLMIHVFHEILSSKSL